MNTDKYEGHVLVDGKWVKHAMSQEEYDATKALIKDAPLLLSEVKRLREGIKEQMQFALDCVGSDIGDLYETIADDLRRLIE